MFVINKSKNRINNFTNTIFVRKDNSKVISYGKRLRITLIKNI